MKNKVTIIGAGTVGATIAYTLAAKDYASEILLVDINEAKAQGEDCLRFQDNGMHGASFQAFQLTAPETFLRVNVLRAAFYF